jgi:hypothetical protein
LVVRDGRGGITCTGEASLSFGASVSVGGDGSCRASCPLELETAEVAVAKLPCPLEKTEVAIAKLPCPLEMMEVVVVELLALYEEMTVTELLVDQKE